MCALGMQAATVKAYANYNLSNLTLTFYYDDLHSTRPGTNYNLNTEDNFPDWYFDYTYVTVTKVVFDPSFAEAVPTSTYAWFYGMVNLQSITGLNYLNTHDVTHMGWMFRNCDDLTSLDLSQFNTAKVTDMNRMFMGCTGLTSLDLSSFNISNVINLRYLFSGCTSLRTIYVGVNWNTAAVAFYTDMFKNCTSLVGGQGTTFNSSHVGIDYAHIDGGTSNPGYFTRGNEAYACYTSWNTTLTFYYDKQRSSRSGTTYDLNSNHFATRWHYDGTYESVTKVVFHSSFADARPVTTYSWFCEMGNLVSITGLNYLNTSELINIHGMFWGCTKLSSLDLSILNTSNIRDMSCLFSDCTGLTSLDLSSFTTTNLQTVGFMFSDCTNLRTIYVGYGWNPAPRTESTSMFYNCTSLVGGQGTTFNPSHVNIDYAHIDGGPSNPGYFTAKYTSLRGDADGDGEVSISDVSKLTDYLLTGNASGVNLTGADADQDGEVAIADVSAIIDYLLSGNW